MQVSSQLALTKLPVSAIALKTTTDVSHLVPKRRLVMVECRDFLPRLLGMCILIMASGCQLLYDYKPVTVVVRDAETKKPIVGAEVGIYYLTMLDPFAPFPSVGKTGQDGVVHLRVAAHDCPIVMRTVADGYVQGRDRFWGDEVHQRGASANGQPDEVVELYSGPGATVELIVPDGFRGLLIADMGITQPGLCLPGQRSFSFNVQPNGLAKINGPPELLWDDVMVDYGARFANGGKLESHPNDAAVGFRWLTIAGHTWFFVVGTMKDYETAKDLIYSKTADDSWYHDYDKIAKLRQQLLNDQLDGNK
jgi:hypothetical protein